MPPVKHDLSNIIRGKDPCLPSNSQQKNTFVLVDLLVNLEVYVYWVL
jgi:hypothetical protein